jgi:hypothetical protein
VLSLSHGSKVEAAGPAIVVFRERGVAAPRALAITRALQPHRVVRGQRPLPPRTRSPAEVGNEERLRSIERALERSRRRQEVAEWEACAKEAGDALGDAVEVLASSGRLDVLRDLHLQIGVCLSLGASPGDALPHFRSATLLDETPPPSGLYREEAERELAKARAEVLALRRGKTRISSLPTGAEVWIDGRRRGRTPIDVDVRLGTHFVTLRRFRHEPETSNVLLQPGTAIRFVLAPARRATLRHQLGRVKAGELAPAQKELRQAIAEWSHAGELVTLAPAPGGAIAARLVAAGSGKVLRTRHIRPDDELDQAVCRLLGESCVPESRGPPWWVWPIVGAAVIGTGVAIGFAVDSQRGAVFCPRAGCE